MGRVLCLSRRHLFSSHWTLLLERRTFATCTYVTSPFLLPHGDHSLCYLCYTHCIPYLASCAAFYITQCALSPYSHLGLSAGSGSVWLRDGIFTGRKFHALHFLLVLPLYSPLPILPQYLLPLPRFAACRFSWLPYAVQAFHYRDDGLRDMEDYARHFAVAV
jgi:hypothetical protein